MGGLELPHSGTDMQPEPEQDNSVASGQCQSTELNSSLVTDTAVQQV